MIPALTYLTYVKLFRRSLVRTLFRYGLLFFSSLFSAAFRVCTRSGNWLFRLWRPRCDHPGQVNITAFRGAAHLLPAENTGRRFHVQASSVLLTANATNHFHCRHSTLPLVTQRRERSRRTRRNARTYPRKRRSSHNRQTRTEPPPRKHAQSGCRQTRNQSRH